MGAAEFVVKPRPFSQSVVHLFMLFKENHIQNCHAKNPTQWPPNPANMSLSDLKVLRHLLFCFGMCQNRSALTCKLPLLA